MLSNIDATLILYVFQHVALYCYGKMATDLEAYPALYLLFNGLHCRQLPRALQPYGNKAMCANPMSSGRENN